MRGDTQCLLEQWVDLDRIADPEFHLVRVPHAELAADDHVGLDAFGLLGLRQRLAGPHRVHARVPGLATRQQHDIAGTGEDVERAVREQAARDLPAVAGDARLHGVEPQSRRDQRRRIEVTARRRAHHPHAVGRREHCRRAGVTLGTPQRFHHHLDREIQGTQTEVVVVGTQRELADTDDDRSAGIERHGRSE